MPDMLMKLAPLIVIALVPTAFVLWLAGAWLGGSLRQGRWASAGYVFLAGIGLTAGVLLPVLIVVKNAEPLPLWAKALVAAAAALGVACMLAGLGLFNRRRAARPLAMACLLVIVLAKCFQFLRAGMFGLMPVLMTLLSIALPLLVVAYLSRPATAAHYDA